MKKQALFVLMLSSLILSACNNPVAPSESNRLEPSSGEQQPSSQSSEPSSQSSAKSSSSSYSDEPSGVALELTAPENDIHTDLQYSYLKDPDWRILKHTFQPQALMVVIKVINPLLKPYRLSLKMLLMLKHITFKFLKITHSLTLKSEQAKEII